MRHATSVLNLIECSSILPFIEYLKACPYTKHVTELHMKNFVPASTMYGRVQKLELKSYCQNILALELIHSAFLVDIH